MASINASTSGAGGVITTADATGNLNLQSAGTTVAALTSTGMAVTGTLSASGQATIPTINLTGGQITFPATQSASADANCLDDYEEGTWTPQLTFGGSSSGMVTGVAQASYTKVGRIVQVTFDYSYSTKGGATGTVNIAGLPFPATGSATAQGYSLGVMTFESNGATTTIVSPYVLAWEDSTLFLRANNGASTFYTNLTNSNFGTTSEVYGSCVYRTAA